jgi:hypothetical protein
MALSSIPTPHILVNVDDLKFLKHICELSTKLSTKIWFGRVQTNLSFT